MVRSTDCSVDRHNPGVYLWGLTNSILVQDKGKRDME